MNDNKLEHVGVLGMKWGVRRGSINTTKGSSKKKLSDEEVTRLRKERTKKILIVGSAAVAAGLAAYGAMKLSKIAKDKTVRKKQIEEVNAFIKEHRAKMAKMDVIAKGLLSDQNAYEKIYGPPTLADLQWAKESLKREGVKF